jgi:hypothetical protein
VPKALNMKEPEPPKGPRRYFGFSS